MTFRAAKVFGPPVNKVQSKCHSGGLVSAEKNSKWFSFFFSSDASTPCWFAVFDITRDRRHSGNSGRTERPCAGISQIATCTQITSTFKVHLLFQTKDAYILQRVIYFFVSVPTIFCFTGYNSTKLFSVQVPKLAIHPGELYTANSSTCHCFRSRYSRASFLFFFPVQHNKIQYNKGLFRINE